MYFILGFTDLYKLLILYIGATYHHRQGTLTPNVSYTDGLGSIALCSLQSINIDIITWTEKLEFGGKFCVIIKE